MAKSKKRKPSFDSTDDSGSGDAAPWVYRSDGDAPAPGERAAQGEAVRTQPADFPVTSETTPEAATPSAAPLDGDSAWATVQPGAVYAPGVDARTPAAI